MNDFDNCLENMNPDMYNTDTCVNITSENWHELLPALKSMLENVSNLMRTK